MVIYRRDTSKRWACVRALSADHAREIFDGRVNGKFLYEILDVHLAGEDDSLPRSLVDRSEPEVPEGRRVPGTRLSCGCCTDGCVCWNHQDTPRGVTPQICAYHRWHRATEGYR